MSLRPILGAQYEGFNVVWLLGRCHAVQYGFETFRRSQFLRSCRQPASVMPEPKDIVLVACSYSKIWYCDHGWNFKGNE